MGLCNPWGHRGVGRAGTPRDRAKARSTRTFLLGQELIKPPVRVDGAGLGELSSAGQCQGEGQGGGPRALAAPAAGTGGDLWVIPAQKELPAAPQGSIPG